MAATAAMEIASPVKAVAKVATTNHVVRDAARAVKAVLKDAAVVAEVAEVVNARVAHRANALTLKANR